MLFYLKKHIALELIVGAALGGVGWLAIWSLRLPVSVQLDGLSVAWGCGGAIGLILWTLLVQAGYSLARGRQYADQLTRALASHFERAGAAQIFAAFVAAAGEEVFFRGFIQGAWGVWIGALAFMLAHIGKRDIRVIGYWSIFQGLGLGLLYRLTDNLLVPVVAHGLFDMGAMFYFRRLMATSPAPTGGSL